MLLQTAQLHCLTHTPLSLFYPLVVVTGRSIALPPTMDAGACSVYYPSRLLLYTTIIMRVDTLEVKATFATCFWFVVHCFLSVNHCV